jgi:hypothetical protein
VDAPSHHPRRAQAEEAGKCLEKVFKFNAGLPQQLGVVYWLLGVHALAVTQMQQVQIVVPVLTHFLLGPSSHSRTFCSNTATANWIPKALARTRPRTHPGPNPDPPPDPQGTRKMY